MTWSGENSTFPGFVLASSAENGSVEPYSLSLAIAESLGSIVDGVR